MGDRDEATIRRVVGNKAITAKQLQQLIAASKEPNVTLQIVPFDAGAHPGVPGSFVITEFPSGTISMWCTPRL
ncbi:Scr1 family TA system antitoxin-like transcriptional regulator [Kitasatospora sp. NPDC017646]|uniref:Scr1 family TA system antitoxin-like transcriptional regulator n=1 Tax=Kitasatospora sp. NPDC017646 TaxID=3364024 RepID=UPI0037AAD868